jgi:hypothetical protein
METLFQISRSIFLEDGLWDGSNTLKKREKKKRGWANDEVALKYPCYPWPFDD